MATKAQVKSKERVAARGEVFTAEREVNAMLDLVQPECLRPDSRFLEPACGDGNFLIAILSRKLNEVKRRYRGSARDYERHAVEAISSLYGVDIMQDNVEACRTRLFNAWKKAYKARCKETASDEVLRSVQFILERNIVLGNALTMRRVDVQGNDLEEPIVFSEWAFIGSNVQRTDYAFDKLLQGQEQYEEGEFVERYVTHYKKLNPYG